MQTYVFRVAKRTQEKRRIGVQAACQTCRFRKLACDGQRPRCSRCQRRGEPECVYDTQRAEETRMQAMRREMKVMKDQLDHVAQTLTALRDLPADGAARLIIDVLNHPDPTSSLIEIGIKIQAQHSKLRHQISELETIQAVFPNIKSSVQFELYLYFPKWYPPLAADDAQPALTGSSLFDFVNWHAARSGYLDSCPQYAPTTSAFLNHGERPDGFQISSWNLWIENSCLSFWTNIPISVALAERAFNVYLSTDHVLFGFMDTELFLRDFARCEHRFCSEALVNAVLHYGCMKIARCDPEAAELVSCFRSETESALRNDATINLNKIAALNIHYTAVVFGGPFHQAVTFLDKAIALCEVFYGWYSSSSQYEAWCRSSEDERAMSHVLWSVCTSANYKAHRWNHGIPPPVPRLPVPYLDLSTRRIVKLPSFSPPDLEKIACERYIYAAISANIPYVRESVMLHLAGESMSVEDRASTVASIYRRALDNHAKLERPRSLHAKLTDVAAISQMWSHLWVLSLLQPLAHYRGPVPGFQASGGTAGAIYVASARQLQHMVFLYQQYHSLVPPTTAYHGPLFVAAVALTQIRRVSNRGPKFEALLWIFADLAISFPGLRDLMQSLALTGYGAGLVNLEQIRELFDRFSEMCRVDNTGSFQKNFVSTADASEKRQIAAALREKSYDTYFATTDVIEQVDEEDEPSV